MAETLLAVVENQTFQQEKVVLDGRLFSKCMFRQCTLVYSGGDYKTHECIVSPGCQWEFLGAANRTMNTIRTLCDTIPSLRSQFFPNWQSWRPENPGTSTVQ